MSVDEYTWAKAIGIAEIETQEFAPETFGAECHKLAVKWHKLGRSSSDEDGRELLRTFDKFPLPREWDGTDLECGALICEVGPGVFVVVRWNVVLRDVRAAYVAGDKASRHIFKEQDRG